MGCFRMLRHSVYLTTFDFKMGFFILELSKKCRQHQKNLVMLCDAKGTSQSAEEQIRLFLMDGLLS